MNVTLNTLFVYGTLMRGQSGHAIVERHAPLSIAEDRVRGRLLKIDWYPGLVLGGGGWVHGQVITFADLEPVFADVDLYEDTEYTRVILKTDSGTLCWAYLYIGAREGTAVIESGDWRKREHLP